MLDHGPAGAGAREVHARRQAARLRRMQEAGCSEEELAVAIEDAPAHETAWLTGANGEARVGQVLREWAQATGFAVLIDVTPPGRRANIDFIAIGRGGVAVIDAKAWSGALRFAGDSVWIGRHGKRKDLEAVGRQVEQVAAVLAASGLALPVGGMLCMANENAGLPAQRLVSVGAVEIGTPDAVGRAIGASGPVAGETIDGAVAALGEAFAARGVIPRTEPVSTAMPSAPRRRIARRRVARGRGQLAARALGNRWGRLLVLVAAGVATVAFGLAPDASTALGPGDVRAALPDLRQAAGTAAGGTVRGPAIATTDDHFRLTFRRGRCRVIVRIDRAAPDVFTGSTVTAGRSCRGR